MAGLVPPPGNMQTNRFASMTSVTSVTSMLPPGHGYVPKKEKPEKPYGLSYTTVMNRTHRGPGRKYLRYALAFGIAAIFFLSGAALYFGHRNVSRMIVYRTEVLGAFMVVLGILCVYMAGNCIWNARVASNEWRNGVRFRPEGLNTVAAYNEAYVPEDVHGEKLASGTYGPKALKEIPKPRLGKAKNKARSKDNLDQIGNSGRTMDTVDEADEGHAFTVEGAPDAGPYPARPPFHQPRGPPPAGFRPRGPPPPGWRGPPPGGFGPRGPPPPGWRPPPPGWRGPRPRGGIPPQPQRGPPQGPGPHQLQDVHLAGPPHSPVRLQGPLPGSSESEL